MLISVLFCMNVAVAGVATETPSFATETVLSVERSIDAAADASAAAKKSRVKVDEEIEVTGERLQDTLHGSLGVAFRAFQRGDFVKAEQKFGKLARRAFSKALKRAHDRSITATVLNLPLGRRATFTEADWNTEDAPPSSAPNAQARSIDYVVTAARSEAAASELYFMKAVAQERQGKVEEALKSYRRAIRLNKKNLDARLEYSLLSLRKGDLETAGVQLARLEKLLDRKCAGARCGFSSASEARYDLVGQAYSSLYAEATRQQ